MKIIVIVLLLLTSNLAWACESYEQCMSESDTLTKDIQLADRIKAIAIKLEEISQKLDRLPEPSPFQQMAQRAAKKND